MKEKQAKKSADELKFEAFMKAVQALQIKHGFQITAEPVLQDGRIMATLRVVKAGP